MPSSVIRASGVRHSLGLLLAVLIGGSALLAVPARAQTPTPVVPSTLRHQDIPLGTFFPTGAVDEAGRPIGFAVYDDGQAMLNQQYHQLHGFANLGVPISQRFSFQGAPAQAFEKGILVWRSDGIGAELLNVFDILHDQGRDAWLQERYGVPQPVPWPNEPPDFASINRRHQAVLDADPALRHYYFEEVDFPVLRHGLPMSEVEEIPGGTIVRNQRTVLVAHRSWPDWLPVLGRANVEMLPAGIIAAEAGLVPADALIPGPAPERKLPLVALESGLRIAVQDIRRETTDGLQRIEVDVRYTNRQPIRRAFNAFDFTILDEGKVQYLPGQPVEGFLGAGTIGPNAEVMGTIAFTVPPGRDPRVLRFAGWDYAAPPLDFPLSAVLP